MQLVCITCRYSTKAEVGDGLLLAGINGELSARKCEREIPDGKNCDSMKEIPTVSVPEVEAKEGEECKRDVPSSKWIYNLSLLIHFGGQKLSCFKKIPYMICVLS